MLKKEVNETNKSNFSLENNLISQLIEKFGKDRQIMQTLEEFSESICVLATLSFMLIKNFIPFSKSKFLKSTKKYYNI